jgi:hypothetical protein
MDRTVVRAAAGWVVGAVLLWAAPSSGSAAMAAIEDPATGEAPDR